MIWKRILAVTALLFAFSLFAVAQSDDASEPEGKPMGGYRVRQSFEFGGRVNTGFGGNLSMYNSLVNLQSGPRLIDQSFSMRSENHHELLFDDLSESATGFGGDPNQIGRLRISKNKLYDFSAVYRHDQYYSDYNLLGNSLAVASSNPLNVNVFNQSPHLMGTRRNLMDFDLKLLPQSWLSFRVGYSHGNDEGPAYTSQHSPGDVLYLENFSTRSDRYRVGITLKPFTRTQFSYDFLYEHDRNDTTGIADVNAVYLLGSDSPTAIHIDPGFSFDPNAKIPSCTFTAGTNGTVANSTCSGFISYNRSQPVRTNLPTHQIGFSSSYFRWLDLAGSASYTSGSSKVTAYQEYYSRFASPTYSQNGIFGSLSNAQLTGNADFKATVHFNSSWSFDEVFRWVNWRNPVSGSYTNALTTNLTAGTILTPAALPSPTTMTLYYNFLGENSKYNTLRVNWSPNRYVSAYIGYKLGLRAIGDRTQTNTYTIATDTTAVGTPAGEVEDETEHHAIIGFNARPLQQWRVNVDGDLMSSNGAYTLISPRHAQTLKAKSSYQINERVTVAGSVGIDARRNDGGALFPAAFITSAGIPYTAHGRTYDLSFDVHAARNVDVNVGWSYDDIYEHAPQCIPLTPGSANYNFGSTNGVANTCRFTTGAARTNVYPMYSNYAEKTNTGYVLFVVKPVKRVTLNLGYDITSNSGYQHWLRADNNTPFLMPVDASGNAVVATTQVAAGSFAGLYPWMPQGSLAYNWHRPVAAISVDMAKGLTFKGAFNNYDYNEKGVQTNPVMGRDFHGNTFTLSLKHSF